MTTSDNNADDVGAGWSIGERSVMELASANEVGCCGFSLDEKQPGDKNK
jgi:hypothetical protein